MQDSLGECNRAYPTAPALHPANRRGGSQPHPYGFKKNTFQDDNFQSQRFQQVSKGLNRFLVIPVFFAPRVFALVRLSCMCVVMAGHARTLLQRLGLRSYAQP